MAGRAGEALVLGFRGLRLPAWLREFEARFGLGGVILFDVDVRTRTAGRNVQSPEQVRALCRELAALPSRPLVLVDQEGGHVRRLKESLGFAPLPSAEAFAGLVPEERVRIARASLLELAALGIHYTLAPVVDLNYNPSNPDIGAHQRSYSADPSVVRACVQALDEAAKEANVGLCLKHYPGLGGATVNSHEEWTDLSGTIRDEQLALFHDLGGTIHGEAVLVSHGHVRQWDPVHPVSMSPVAIGALRGRLPRALLVSDDLQMQGLQVTHPTAAALRQGLAAGLDLLILGNNLVNEEEASLTLAEGLEAAIAGDPMLAQRLREAAARVRDRKERLRR
jgi:beta-N-acetylhexosaminidase